MQSQQNQTGTSEDSTEQETTSFTLFITTPNLKLQQELPIEALEDLTTTIQKCLVNKSALRSIVEGHIILIPYEVLSTSIIELVCA